MLRFLFLVVTFWESACAAPEVTVIDFSADQKRMIVVDREKDQYLGHVSTCLLDDGKTILAVYPKGHGRGATSIPAASVLLVGSTSTVGRGCKRT